MSNKYQQGDVLLKEIEQLPDNKKAPYEGDKIELLHYEDPNKVILALGEATGHHHRFELDKLPPSVLVKGYGKKSTVKYLTHMKAEGGRESEYIEIKGGQATLYHEEHNPIEIPSGAYEVSIVREFDHLSQTTRRVWD